MRIRPAVIAGLCVLAFFVLGLGVILPGRLIGSGLEDFGGREKRMASGGFFHVAQYYGDSFLEYDDYIGPPLVLGWHIEGLEECPGAPSRKDIEGNSYRAVGGASATVEAYTLFGIPRGEMKVTCAGRREWTPYF